MASAFSPASAKCPAWMRKYCALLPLLRLRFNRSLNSARSRSVQVIRRNQSSRFMGLYENATLLRNPLQNRDAHALADAHGRAAGVDVDHAFQRADVVDHEGLEDHIAFLRDPVGDVLDFAGPFSARVGIVLDHDFLALGDMAGPLLQDFGTDNALGIGAELDGGELGIARQAFADLKENAQDGAIGGRPDITFLQGQLRLAFLGLL